MSKLYLMTKDDMRAELLKLIQEGIDLNPIGTIISFIGQQPPMTYLHCDGGQYVIDDYQELADFIVVNFGAVNYFGGDGERYFAVPDLRGEFLRGAGANSHANGGSGAAVGVHQPPTEHKRIVYNMNKNLEAITPTAMQYNEAINMDKVTGESGKTQIGNASVWAGVDAWAATSHYTSRPTNTSVLFCIKAKNR